MWKKVSEHEAIEDQAEQTLRFITGAEFPRFLGISFQVRGKELRLGTDVVFESMESLHTLVFFPENLRWSSPHSDEPISAETRATIKTAIQDACSALGEKVFWSDPLGD